MTKWLIIGGTGTLGHALLDQLFNPHEDGDSPNYVTIFSRDEFKQHEMKKRYPWAKFVIGDIKDYESVEKVVKGHDVVFHFAALKHVDVGEENPDEAVKTNYVGTKNIAQACQRSGVKKLIFSSTDKAVDPVNAYGMAKALAEKLLLAEYRSISYIFRWGNVVGSRGSVIPFFVSKIKAGEAVPVTHPEMSRFWIKIDEAVNFMLRTIQDPPTEDVYIPSMRGYPVLGIIKLIGQIINYAPTIDIVGMRPGEKIHECLLRTQDFAIQSNNCEQYSEDQMLSLLGPLC